MGTQHETRGVQAHYASLADSYDAKANRACKRAYGRLVSRTLAGATCALELGAGSGPLLDLLDAHVKVACDLSVEMLSQRARSGPPPDPARVTGSLSASARTAAQALADKLPVAPGMPEVPGSAADANPAGGALADKLPVAPGMTVAPEMAVAGDGQRLPFCAGAFDAVFSINVLEHVPEPAAVLRESARVLRPGGLFLAVTPNGDVEWLLDLLERLRLKLPEGPHRFLGTAELSGLAGADFAILEHRRLLAFPAGPDWAIRGIDRIGAGKWGRGLFQYLLLERN